MKEIDFDKNKVKDIFKDWYTVPAYQRHYVWESDNVIDMLKDFQENMELHSDNEYFMGSYIYQSKDNEKDLLDGQQRITTLFLLFAYLRDYGNLDEKLRNNLHSYVYQEADPFEMQEARVRLQYEIRGDVKLFVEHHIAEKGALSNNSNWEDIELRAKSKTENVSIAHLCNTLVTFKRFFSENPTIDIVKYLQFILNNVVMIYISATTLADAFRLFSIMNDRGLKLSNADILKSSNLEKVPDEKTRNVIAQKWENMQDDLGDDFDRFLSYVRTMLLKSRARTNLLDEFENNIFGKGVINKGEDFFTFVFKAYNTYNSAIELEDIEENGNYKYINLITILRDTYISTDWIPVVMNYYGKYHSANLYDFTYKMIRKNLADVICGQAPSTRIENLNKIMSSVENSTCNSEVLNNQELYSFDKDKFISILNMDIYGRRYAKTLLMLLELKYHSDEVRVASGIINIEHILPQNPTEGSQWTKDFTFEQRYTYTHKIGNLCLISRKKNTSLGNLDYVYKKERYFKGKIDVFSRTLSTITHHLTWKPKDIEENQKKTLDDIKEMFNI